MKEIKSQAVIDMVTIFFGETEKEGEEEMSLRVSKTIMNATSIHLDNGLWIIFFDRFAAKGNGGARTVLTSLEEYVFT